MTVLQEVTATVSAIADRIGASVVALRGGGRGSGVVVAEGRVATNAHNIRGETVEVRFADGRVVTGQVAGFDVDADLAVVTVDTGAAPPIAFADASPAPGTVVFALAPNRITVGFVSSVSQSFRGPRGRRISEAIEHTAPLVRGSSGGPIVDADGRLLGINTHRRGGGFYLALPASADLRSALERLGRGDAEPPVRLGIAVAPPHVAHRLRSAVGLTERDGLLVRDVDEAGAAAAAGVRRGDLIVGAGGRDVGSSDDLFALLDDAPRELSLTLVRGDEEVELTVTLGGTP
ncbi:MAG: S1C family serine protease [Actinobacteria bacterium]|nr:S1C family serine protease [Actinomycetota bacterium]